MTKNEQGRTDRAEDDRRAVDASPVADVGVIPETPQPDLPAQAPPAGPSLRTRTTQGFLWSFGSAGGQAILQIVGVAVLGHILTPHQYGIVNASMLAVTFAAMFGQLGVAAAIVQKAELTDKQVSAAFSFSIAITAAIGVVFWLVAPWLNLLVGLPESSIAIRLLAFQLPIVGLTIVPMGLLQRNLRFKQLAIVDTSSYAIGVVGLGVTLALLGVGELALVWGQLADVTMTAIGYCLLSRVPWRFQRPREMVQNVRGLLRFGLSYSFNQVGNWTATNGDNFIIANRLTTADLGVYGRAYTLLAQPANLIGGVADKVLFPAMSRVQHDPPRMVRAYVSACAFVAFATVPATVILFVGAQDLVKVLLGDRWDGVVAPLQLFALVLLPRTSYKISGSFTRARGAVLGGAARQWLYAGEVILGCLIGSMFGVIGVAIGATAAITLHWLTMIAFSARVSPGLWTQLGITYLRYLPLAAATTAAGFAAKWATRGIDGHLIHFVAIVVAILGATVVVVAVFRKAFSDELRLARDLFRGLRRRAASA